MSNPPFEPMERDAAAKIEAIIGDLAKDCDELAATSASGKMDPGKVYSGKMDGVQHGISRIRELTVALKSLLNSMQSGR
jgi:hypothetical protein